MLVRTLLICCLALFAFTSCKRENFEKIRMNPGVDFRYDKAFEYYNKGDFQKAQYLFEDLMGIIKLSEKAERVYYHYAQTHYKLKNYISSSYYLNSSIILFQTVLLQKKRFF